MTSSALPSLHEMVSFTDEQFYLETADHVLSDMFGSTPHSKPHRIEIAKKWLVRLSNECNGKICNNHEIMAFVENESGLEILGKAIFDGLLSDLSPVPATFITAHVLRMGLRNFCSDRG